jgi:hypothetical protein
VQQEDLGKPFQPGMIQKLQANPKFWQQSVLLADYEAVTIIKNMVYVLTSCESNALVLH